MSVDLVMEKKKTYKDIQKEANEKLKRFFFLKSAFPPLVKFTDVEGRREYFKAPDGSWRRTDKKSNV